MTDKKSIARVAGLVYLVVVLTGIISLAYIPQKLISWNDSKTTFSNISTNQLLFRIGIYSSVICFTAFIFLPLILYKLFKTVSETAAIFMVVLALISVPLSFGNLKHKYDILNLVNNDTITGTLKSEEVQTSIMASLHQYDSGVLLATVFWGLWLFPFGLLVYKSGFIPRFFAVLLILGCIGYLINFTGHTLIHDYSKLGVAKYISLLPAIGEIGICIWFLLFGINERIYEKK